MRLHTTNKLEDKYLDAWQSGYGAVLVRDNTGKLVYYLLRDTTSTDSDIHELATMVATELRNYRRDDLTVFICYPGSDENRRFKAC